MKDLDIRKETNYYIKCDNCYPPSSDVTQDENPQEVFKSRGWKVIRHKTLCPDCSKDFRTHLR